MNKIKSDTVQYLQKGFRYGKFVSASVIEIKKYDLFRRHNTSDIVELIKRWNREGSRMSSITGLSWEYQLVDPSVPVKNVLISKDEYVDWSETMKKLNRL